MEAAKRDLDEINKDLTDSVGLDTEQSAVQGKKKGGTKKSQKKVAELEPLAEEPQEQNENFPLRKMGKEFEVLLVS